MSTRSLPSGIRHGWQVAAHVRLIGRRDEKTLRSRIGPAIVLIGIVVMISVLDATADGRDNVSTRTVGVAMADDVTGRSPGLASDVLDSDLLDIDGLDGDVLGQHGLESVSVRDASAATTAGEVDVGIVVDAATGDVRLFVDTDDGDSKDAAARVRLALADADGDPLAAVHDVRPTRRVRDLDTARALLFGLAFASQFGMGWAAGSLTDAASAKVLEPIALLPVDRRTLGLGFSVGFLPAVVTSLLAFSAIIVCVALAPVAGLGLPAASIPTAIVGLGVAIVGLAPVTAAVASVISIGTAGRQRTAAGTAIMLPYLLAGFLAAQNVIDTPPVFSYLPVLSSFGVAGDGFLGTLDLGDSLLSILSGLVATMLLVEVVRRMLSGDAVAKR